MSSMAEEMDILEDPEEKACREAFEYYDWNKSGTIPFSVQIIFKKIQTIRMMIIFHVKVLQCAMRRAGQNPTDVEVQDIMNKIDDGSGTLNVEDFVGMDFSLMKASPLKDCLCRCDEGEVQGSRYGNTL